MDNRPPKLFMTKYLHQQPIRRAAHTAETRHPYLESDYSESDSSPEVNLVSFNSSEFTSTSTDSSPSTSSDKATNTAVSTPCSHHDATTQTPNVIPASQPNRHKSKLSNNRHTTWYRLATQCAKKCAELHPHNTQESQNKGAKNTLHP